MASSERALCNRSTSEKALKGQLASEDWSSWPDKIRAMTCAVKTIKMLDFTSSGEEGVKGTSQVFQMMIVVHGKGSISILCWTFLSLRSQNIFKVLTEWLKDKLMTQWLRILWMVQWQKKNLLKTHNHFIICLERRVLYLSAANKQPGGQNGNSVESAREILSPGFPDRCHQTVEQQPVATWQLSVKVLYTVYQITFNTATLTHTRTHTNIYTPPSSPTPLQRLHQQADLWPLASGASGDTGSFPAESLQCPSHTGVIVGSAAPSVHSSTPPFTSRLLHSITSLLHFLCLLLHSLGALLHSLFYSVLRCLTGASQLITGSWGDVPAPDCLFGLN